MDKRIILKGKQWENDVRLTLYESGAASLDQDENNVLLLSDQVAQLRAALGVDADLAAELKRQIATERNLYQAKLLSLENDKADLLAERDVLKQCVLDYTEFAGHAAHCAAIESSREHECDCGFYQIMERHGDLIKRLIAERAEQIIAVITEHYQKP